MKQERKPIRYQLCVCGQRIRSLVNMGGSSLRSLCLILAVASGLAVQAPTFKLYDGTEIPALALGTWLGHTPQGPVAAVADEVQTAVQWAIDAGYRHIDTASRYGIEDQVGRGIAAKVADGSVKRDDLFVTTKLWNDQHAKEAVVPALRRSLKDLQLDYVDLYLIHWPTGTFPNGTFDETDYLETWRGMVEAQTLGLAKHVGLSNFNENQIGRIINDSAVKPAVLQVELNLNLQQPALLSYCKVQGIAVMGYTPFGSLFPSRAKPDAPEPRVSTPELRALAERHHKTVPQVVLRYLYELGVIAIPKSVTKERIEQNIDIFDFQLTEEDRGLLKAFDKHYRTIPQDKWVEHAHYPFEKKIDLR